MLALTQLLALKLMRRSVFWLVAGLNIIYLLAQLLRGTALGSSSEASLLALGSLRWMLLCWVALGFCSELREDEVSGRRAWLRAQPVSVLGRVVAELLSVSLVLLLLVILWLLPGLPLMWYCGVGLAPVMLAVLGEYLASLILASFSLALAPRMARLSSSALIMAAGLAGHLRTWPLSRFGTGADEDATLWLLLQLAPRLDSLTEPGLSAIQSGAMHSPEVLILTGLYASGYVLLGSGAAVALESSST